MLLGALTRELDRLRLLSPSPTKPFLLLSYNHICDRLKTIQSPIWEHKSVNLSGDPVVCAHNCSLQTIVSGVVSADTATLIGLDLKQTKDVEPSLSGLFSRVFGG
jgi:hypothetical protein